MHKNKNKNPSMSPGSFVAGSAIMAIGAIAGLKQINRSVMPVIDKGFFRPASYL
jgi:hypothetical protein